MTALTARDLLTLARPYRPVVDGKELAFELDLPEDLLPSLSVLHTGVRAQLAGRGWWGSSDHSSKRPKVAPLDPGKTIPDWCGLLCVEGDHRWDRIHPAARLDFPRLFDSDSAVGSFHAPERDIRATRALPSSDRGQAADAPPGSTTR